MRAILYTSHTGGVEVCYPTQEILDCMAVGVWRNKPSGFFDEQIERQVAAGHHESAAVRYVRAMGLGGVTEAEAYAIIRDRDCGQWGTAHDLIDTSELPDRWFRDAWTRSHNGGPINLDLGKARKIQYAKIVSRLERANNRLRHDLDAEPIAIDLAPIRTRIRTASDDNDLRRVWPEALGAP